MSKQNSLIGVLLIVIFTGVGFFSGTKYQQNKTALQRRQFTDRMPSATGNNAQGNKMRLGGGQIIGEISTQDEKTITVKLADGSSKIILLSEKTSINKASQGLMSDLKIGGKVAIFGNTNTDGSVTAQNIQIQL